MGIIPECMSVYHKCGTVQPRASSKGLSFVNKEGMRSQAALSLFSYPESSSLSNICLGHSTLSQRSVLSLLLVLLSDLLLPFARLRHMHCPVTLSSWPAGRSDFETMSYLVDTSCLDHKVFSLEPQRGKGQAPRSPVGAPTLFSVTVLFNSLQ